MTIGKGVVVAAVTLVMSPLGIAADAPEVGSVITLESKTNLYDTALGPKACIIGSAGAQVYHDDCMKTTKDLMAKKDLTGAKQQLGLCGMAEGLFAPCHEPSFASLSPGTEVKVTALKPIEVRVPKATPPTDRKPDDDDSAWMETRTYQMLAVTILNGQHEGKKGFVRAEDVAKK